MKMIKIPNSTKKEFNGILKVIAEETPFGLRNQFHVNATAYFFFEDSSYIPEVLKEFTMEIPDNPEKTKRINDKLKRTLEI